MGNDLRGSNWRIWDLHVHTPESHETHYGGPKEEAWEKFIKDLEALPKNIKVIGVNDYLFIDGYKRLLTEKENGRLPNIDLFLPVIELRLRQFTGNNHLSKINYHIIFSNELKASEIEEYFIKHLGLKYVPQSGEAWERNLINRDSLAEFGKAIREDTPVEKRNGQDSDLIIGFKNADFELKAIESLLASSIFAEKYITAIGKVEWTSHQWDNGVAAKKQIINSVDMIFTASESSETCLRSIESLKAQGVRSKLFHCSDSHYLSNSAQFQRIGSCFTWIKSDTTFQGLKYALEEYDDRVFIGQIPPKLHFVNMNPTKFIDTVVLNKKAESNFDESWFGGEVEFNSDLIAVIGNKGSGKSALADILGLLGNSQREEDFSFLRKERFRHPKSKKATHFEAKIKWKSGLEISKGFDESVDMQKSELVKYIPQNFLEKICNEVGSETETEFDREVKKVIFSHVDEASRLRQGSLDDLLKFRMEEANSRIAKLKAELNKVNLKIVSLERKATRKELARVQEMLARKQRELEAHNNIKPIEPQMQSQDPVTSKALEAVTNEIAEKRKVFEQLSETIRQAKVEKNTEALRLVKVQKIIAKVENFHQEASDFETDLQFDLNDFGLATSQIFEIEINKAILVDLENKLKVKNKKIADSLNEDLDESNAKKLIDVQEEILKLQQQLDEPGRKRQQYLQAVNDWNKKREHIVGSKEIPESLEFLLEQVAISKTYPLQIENEKKARILIIGKIVDEIQQLAEIFKGYYNPLEIFVSKHKLASEKFQFNFSVEKHVGSFTDKFFEWVERSGAGPFSGLDSGLKYVNQIIETSSFDSKDGIIEFLKNILKGFADSDSSLGTLECIEKKLKKGKRIEDFYNFLFSLDYIRPKYILKWGEKELDQLSPGQKGLLLLSFYLIVDKDDIPLIIDQPEENLDNQTVYNMLVPFIKEAKNRRQIVLVTHNPNLAVVCDAEQIIWSDLDANTNSKITYTTGAVENPNINVKLVDILEGTRPAFNKRDRKYFEKK